MYFNRALNKIERGILVTLTVRMTDNPVKCDMKIAEHQILLTISSSKLAFTENIPSYCYGIDLSALCMKFKRVGGDYHE